MSVRAAAGDVANGVATGYLGAVAMEPVNMYLYRHEPDHGRDTEDVARPGPPYRVAAEKITCSPGVTLSDEILDKVAFGRWSSQRPLSSCTASTR